MPKKPTKKTRKPKTKKNDFEHKMEHFGEEVSQLGKKFGNKMDTKAHMWKRQYYKTFGFFGPLVSSLFSILIVALFALILNYINLALRSMILTHISLFLLTNLGFFFMVFVFFSYMSFISKFYAKESDAWSPIIMALGIVIGLWVAVELMIIINASLGISVISTITLQISRNLLWVFLFVAILGYVVVFARNAEREHKKHVKRPAITKSKMHAYQRGDIRRLYRSSKEKILGGVCGGIGEYFGVDPVLIRLLWVVGSLVWGFGILMYIIAWIIIPRNPYQKWVE